MLCRHGNLTFPSYWTLQVTSPRVTLDTRHQVLWMAHIHWVGQTVPRKFISHKIFQAAASTNKKRSAEDADRDRRDLANILQVHFVILRRSEKD
jgi:hypothetical protein